MITPITIEDVDRTIYENIRLVLVQVGVLPDIRNYATEVAYNAAKDVIRAEGNLIEIYGVGTSESRDDKSVTKIIIDRRNSDNGTLGGYPSTQFNTLGTGKFNKVSLPDMTMDIEYDVRVITNSTRLDRIAGKLIMAALGSRKYVPIVIDDVLSTETMLINFLGDIDMSKVGFKERIYKYGAMDLWISDSLNNIISENIPPMTSVDFVIASAGISEKIQDGEELYRFEVKDGE